MNCFLGLPRPLGGSGPCAARKSARPCSPTGFGLPPSAALLQPLSLRPFGPVYRKSGIRRYAPHSLIYPRPPSPRGVWTNSISPKVLHLP